VSAAANQETRLIAVRLPEELAKQFDMYRFERMYESKQAAMEAIVRAGLKANPPKPKDAK
jgi:metal-responsive CopG/Arc/MetJ family transcriptional regulator